MLQRFLFFVHFASFIFIFMCVLGHFINGVRIHH